MAYPEKIIPLQNYKLINEKLNNHFLIRHTKDKDFVHKETGRVRTNYICEPREQLLDLSTNLLGVFTPEETKVELIGNRKHYYLEYWSEGEAVDAPVKNVDFQTNNNRGYFFFPIEEINNKCFIAQKKDGTKVNLVCKVLHTPARWNFWHFSIRWTDSSGNPIEPGKKLNKNVLSATRNLISEYAKISEPIYFEIDSSAYLEK